MSDWGIRANRWRRSSAGQNLVEFAAASLLLIPLLLGILEFGWAFFVKHELANAAREGARWAAVHGTGCQQDPNCGQLATSVTVQNYIVQRITIPNPNTIQVTLSAPDGSLDPGKHVLIQLQYPFTPLVGYVIRAPTITFKASSEMIIHY